MDNQETKQQIYNFIQAKKCFLWKYKNWEWEIKEYEFISIKKIYEASIWAMLPTYKSLNFESFLELKEISGQLIISKEIDTNKWIDEFFIGKPKGNNHKKVENYETLIQGIPEKEWRNRGIIKDIFDGDWWTIYVNAKKTENFRIYGIDAPETDSDDISEYQLSQKAKKQLEDLCHQNNNQVYYRDRNNNETDIYWRMIIEITSIDVPENNFWISILKCGYAIPLYAWDYSPEEKISYLDAVEDAYKHARWARKQPNIHKLYNDIIVERKKEFHTNEKMTKSSFLSKYYNWNQEIENKVIKTIVIWWKHHDLHKVMWEIKKWSKVILKAEPNNPKDKNAIAVYVENMLIWYLPNPDSENTKRFPYPANYKRNKILEICKEKDMKWETINIVRNQKTNAVKYISIKVFI
jgi:endonuclease YncB( thermonuclease family)